MFQPLKDIKVLDCTRLLPYQYCTMILGDLGADVLKIEEPREGDYGRWGDAERTYESIAFVMANRNKRSMRLNLKHPQGKEIFKKLVATSCDVLVESFRPGVMDRLGLGYKELSRVNRQLIYCSSTGYGQTGPYRLRAGHDINYLAYSGMLALSGEHTGRPVIPPIPLGDMAGGGLFTALAIIIALYNREKTGKGQYIDVAQLDVLVSLNILNLAECLANKQGLKARPHNLRGATLCYNTFKTADGKFVALGALEEKFWVNFCKAIKREDLIKDHLIDYEDGHPTTEALKEVFASKTRDEWKEIFSQVDACVDPVLTPEETLENEHLKERKMVTCVDEPIRGSITHLGFPAKFSDELNWFRKPAPFFGEDTLRVLKGLGYTDAEIEGLEKEGVISTAV